MRASLDTFLCRLADLGDRLRTDREAREGASHDESGVEPCLPAAVVRPRNAAEVQRVAREAAELGVGLVPRGTGTGKSGACVPTDEQVVVDLSAMRSIREVRPADLYAVVEPGVITMELDRAAGEHGFMYPPDPSSWDTSTLGGNIATNAGGPRAVKYGVTHRYVWGVEVVLPGGDVVRAGRRSIKGVAGLDIASLMVGSEGTLGFITEATLHIVPAPPSVQTAWLTFTDPLAASRAAERVFAAGLVPRMLELFDAMALEAVRPKSELPIAEGEGAALLVETDGNESQALHDLTRLCEVALDAGATDSAVAQNERDRERMRRARRIVSPCLKERFPHKMSDDVAVPRSRMPELLDRAHQAGEEHGVLVSAYGHLGDGNLHVNLLSAEGRTEAMYALRRRVLEIAVGMGGTVSGEHGIGLTKRDALTLEQTAELIALQRRVKSAFDPKGIMNPGKVWPGSV